MPNSPTKVQAPSPQSHLIIVQAGLSLGAITHNTCYSWVCLIFPWCYGWGGGGGAGVKLPFVDIIHPQSNKFATAVENKGTGDSKLNDSPDKGVLRLKARVEQWQSVLYCQNFSRLPLLLVTSRWNATCIPRRVTLALNSLTLIKHLGGERYSESKMPCPRTWHGDHG